MTSLILRYRELSPERKKMAMVAIIAGVVFDALIIRDILRSDSTKLLPKAGWIAASLLSTPGGGLSYLRYGRG